MGFSAIANPRLHFTLDMWFIDKQNGNICVQKGPMLGYVKYFIYFSGLDIRLVS